jgi:hypothetical protein
VDRERRDLDPPGPPDCHKGLNLFGWRRCCARIEVVTHTPEELRTLRDRLLRVHKALLDSDRAAYERAYGRVESSGEWLQLVLGHEFFGWLRPFSGLIVRIDEWLASDDRTEEELDALWHEVERLTSIAPSTEERVVRYRKAIDRSPDAAFAHGALREVLDAGRGPKAEG